MTRTPKRQPRADFAELLTLADILSGKTAARRPRAEVRRAGGVAPRCRDAAWSPRAQGLMVAPLEGPLGGPLGGRLVAQSAGGSRQAD